MVCFLELSVPGEGGESQRLVEGPLKQLHRHGRLGQVLLPSRPLDRQPLVLRHAVSDLPRAHGLGLGVHALPDVYVVPRRAKLVVIHLFCRQGHQIRKLPVGHRRPVLHRLALVVKNDLLQSIARRLRKSPQVDGPLGGIIFEARKTSLPSWSK